MAMGLENFPDAKLTSATGYYVDTLEYGRSSSVVVVPWPFMVYLFPISPISPTFSSFSHFPHPIPFLMLAMWANMLFWAFLLTTLVYLCVGVACAVSMRLIKKGVSVGIALFFLLYAELRVICGDAIACEYTHTHTPHTHTPVCLDLSIIYMHFSQLCLMNLDLKNCE